MYFIAKTSASRFDVVPWLLEELNLVEQTVLQKWKQSSAHVKEKVPAF